MNDEYVPYDELVHSLGVPEVNVNDTDNESSVISRLELNQKFIISSVQQIIHNQQLILGKLSILEGHPRVPNVQRLKVNKLVRTPISPNEDVFSFGNISALDAQATSIPNLAKLLAEVVFSPMERAESNCLGMKGNKKLDQEKLDKIRKAVFELHPIGDAEKLTVWRRCQDAITEFCRRKPRNIFFRVT